MKTFRFAMDAGIVPLNTGSGSQMLSHLLSISRQYADFIISKQ